MGDAERKVFDEDESWKAKVEREREWWTMEGAYCYIPIGQRSHRIERFGGRSSKRPRLISSSTLVVMIFNILDVRRSKTLYELLNSLSS